MAADHLTDWIRWARLDNAVLERTNSLNAEIKRRTRGFSNVENLISMCYLVSSQKETNIYGRTVTSKWIAPWQSPGAIPLKTIYSPLIAIKIYR